MIPSLFNDGLSTAPATGSIGVGRLTDCISCKVEREINGIYELTIQYPLSGVLYDNIAMRSLILVKPDQMSDPQLFRVYRISKPLKGIVTINARHISYDLDGYTVEPFTALSISTALSGITSHAVPASPFSFSSSRSTAATFTVKKPGSIWSLMAGQEGSLLDVFGGEYEFDNFDITLENRLGTDRGVSIRYGKNLKDINQEENCAAVYTAVYPYYYDTTTNTLVTLQEQTVDVGIVTAFDRVFSLDLTDNFREPPTEDALRSAAESYIASHELGVPEVSLTVQFIPLWQTEEYKEIAVLETVALGDTVTVQFPALGVDATSRAVAFVYDCLKERYEAITLGKVKSSLTAIVAAQAKEIEERPTQSYVERISTMLSEAMIGVHGGAVRLVDTNGDGMPDELYIADSPDINEAVIVWRFNYLGWAVSQTGYNGTYIMGATLQDGLLANAITAAHLTAGTIQSADGETVNIDLDNGIVQMNAQYFALNGNNLDDYFHISFEGGSPVVRIGSSANGIVLKQMSDRISFCDSSGNELAYWNNNSFRLVELQSFQLGNLELVSEPNGSVSFVKPSPYITFCTWNVGLFNDGSTRVPTADAAARISAFQSVIAAIDAEVINNQEFVYYIDSSLTVPTANIMDFKYPFSTEVGEVRTFSEVNIDNQTRVYFASGSGRYYRHGKISIGGKEITVINTHLSYEVDPSVYRSADIQELITFMSTRPYVILSGDFNVYTDAEWNAFTNAGFTLCNGGDFGWFKTWPINISGSPWGTEHLDNIIVSSNIVPQRVETYSTTISDHAPLIAVLKIT